MKWILTGLLVFTACSCFGMSLQDIQSAYYKSYTYEKVQDYDNAVKAMSPLASAYPDGYTINLRLGWLNYLAGHFANANYYYEQAIKAAPGAIEPKLVYLLPLLAQEKFVQAEAVANQILAVDPCNYYGNLRLAYALRLDKKFDAAEKIADKMLTLYPTDASFMTELAETKAAQGDQTKAAGLFQHVLTLDPENTAAKAYLQDGK